MSLDDDEKIAIVPADNAADDALRGLEDALPLISPGEIPTHSTVWFRIHQGVPDAADQLERKDVYLSATVISSVSIGQLGCYLLQYYVMDEATRRVYRRTGCATDTMISEQPVEPQHAAGAVFLQVANKNQVRTNGSNAQQFYVSAIAAGWLDRTGQVQTDALAVSGVLGVVFDKNEPDVDTGITIAH